MRNQRIYPESCTSAFCGTGGDACKQCAYYPDLQAFKRWVEENNAKPADPIWSPLVYVAQPRTRHDRAATL